MSDQVGACRSTLIAALVVVVANGMGAFVDASAYGFGMLVALDIGHAVFAASLALVLSRSRGLWKPRVYELVYAVMHIPFLVDMWLPPIYDMRGGAVHEPLLLHHLIFVGIALLAPTWRVGLPCLLLFLAHALALWRVLEQSITSPALAREPWFTLLTAAVAIGLLWSRISRRALATRLARAEAHADSMIRIGHVVLGLHDRTNTPLQTLTLGLQMLERDPKLLPVFLRSLRDATEQLVATQRTLSDLELPRSAFALEVDLDRSLVELFDASSGERS